MVLSRQNLAAGPGRLPIFFGVIPADAALRAAGKKAKQIQNKAAAKVGTEKSGCWRGVPKRGSAKKWVPQMVGVANGFEPKCDKKRSRKEDTAIAREQKMWGKKGCEEKGGAAAFVAVDCERRRRSYGLPKAIYRAHP